VADLEHGLLVHLCQTTLLVDQGKLVAVLDRTTLQPAQLVPDLADKTVVLPTLSVAPVTDTAAVAVAVVLTLATLQQRLAKTRPPVRLETVELVSLQTSAVQQSVIAAAVAVVA
jgi:hypothetical protein